MPKSPKRDLTPLCDEELAKYMFTAKQLDIISDIIRDGSNIDIVVERGAECFIPKETYKMMIPTRNKIKKLCLTSVGKSWVNELFKHVPISKDEILKRRALQTKLKETGQWIDMRTALETYNLNPFAFVDLYNKWFDNYAPVSRDAEESIAKQMNGKLVNIGGNWAIQRDGTGPDGSTLIKKLGTSKFFVTTPKLAIKRTKLDESIIHRVAELDVACASLAYGGTHCPLANLYDLHRTPLVESTTMPIEVKDGRLALMEPILNQLGFGIDCSPTESSLPVYDAIIFVPKPYDSFECSTFATHSLHIRAAATCHASRYCLVGIEDPFHCTSAPVRESVWPEFLRRMINTRLFICDGFGHSGDQRTFHDGDGIGGDDDEHESLGEELQ